MIIREKDYLMHYGVLGMKWGKRKAKYYSDVADKHQAKANQHISKIGTSKTRIGKGYHNLKAYDQEARANTARAISKTKGVKQTASEVMGRGDIDSRAKAAANYYDRKAGYAKTNLGRTIAKSNSYNQSQLVKDNAKIRNAKGAIRKGVAIVDIYANSKYKTWSGRKTTTGKQVVDGLFTMGMFGTVKDLNYYYNHRKD